MTDQFGPFHRDGNTTTQTDEVAKIQEATKEVWGRTPVQKGYTPTVEAYPLVLEEGEWGINFSTPVKPHPWSGPNHAKWYLRDTKGVESRYKDGEEYACIPADVTRIPPR